MGSSKLNEYEESLVRAFIKLDNQREAYKASLYKSDVMSNEIIDRKASAVLARPRVKEKLEKLKKKASERLDEKAILEVADVLQEVRDLLKTNISDVAEVKTIATIERDPETKKAYTEKDGTPIIDYTQRIILKDFSEMSDAAIKSISEIGYDSNGNVKIKRYDKSKTIDQAGKILAMFTEKVEHSGTVKLAGLEDKEVKDRLERLEKLSKKRADNG